jgi:uncharacterized protein YndB with AHSA1/START domain
MEHSLAPQRVLTRNACLFQVPVKPLNPRDTLKNDFIKVHHLEAKVGGTYKMSFTNFCTGKRHSFGGTFLELTPPERIRRTGIFDDPNLPGEMQTTITFRKVFCGTELNVVQAGIPAAIPAEGCYLGWQESLALLAKLVEAEVPD